MKIFFGALLVILLRNGVYSKIVKVNGNTITGILNQNYTEDVVSVRSKIECAKLCISTQHCEAIYYNKSFDISKCFLRKYTPNILYPLIIDTSLASDTSVMFLRNHEDVWVVGSDYIYNSTLKFWYRAVIDPKATVHDANAACKADGAYLMLIRHQADYDFVINLQHQFGVVRMYLQGTRPTGSDGFVDELGRPLAYYRWDVNGFNGGGLYLRTNSDYDMETSSGSNAYSYICQVLLN